MTQPNELFEPTPPTLEDFMGEGKKYADTNAVAKALQEKEAFIEKLKSENEEMRTDLTARLSIEELLKQTPSEPQKEEPPAEPQAPSEPSDPSPKPDLQEEVLKLLQQEKAKETKELNIAQVRKALADQFGPNYNTTLRTLATTLGVNETFLSDMAATSPQGLLKLVNTIAPNDGRPATPPAPSVDPVKGFGTTAKKNNAYYQALRKDNLAVYLSKKVQSEMHKEAMAQGDSFFS